MHCKDLLSMEQLKDSLHLSQENKDLAEVCGGFILRTALNA